MNKANVSEIEADVYKETPQGAGGASYHKRNSMATIPPAAAKNHKETLPGSVRHFDVDDDREDEGLDPERDLMQN